jgi:hypothetical protein
VSLETLTNCFEAGGPNHNSIFGDGVKPETANGCLVLRTQEPWLGSQKTLLMEYEWRCRASCKARRETSVSLDRNLSWMSPITWPIMQITTTSSNPAPALVRRKRNTLAPYKRCHCGLCRECIDNQKWDERFQKFIAKDYPDQKGWFGSSLGRD